MYWKDVLRGYIVRVCYLGSHECNALVPLEEEDAVRRHELPVMATGQGQSFRRINQRN